MNLNRRNLILLAAAIGIAAGPATAYAADVLNVGAYPTNPPFEYKNESGTFEGFEVDIVNEAAKRAGMTTEILVLTPWPRRGFPCSSYPALLEAF